MVRTFVSFEGDFPDDGEWDESGHVVRPRGRAISEFLQNSLRSISTHIVRLANHEDFEWEFGCSIGRTRVWVLLQFAEPWLVIVHLQPWILNPLRGRKGPEVLKAVCRTIDQAMRGDPRFRKVQWFTGEEYSRVSSSP
jgi:hypothetical protein